MSSSVAAKLEPSPLRPGSLFNRYIVIEVIGMGSAGIVYAAYDPNLDRKVALKLVRTAGRRRSERRRARLIREAQSLARLSHPHVIPVYEVGEAGEQVFVAMEFVEGQTLRAWQEASPKPWAELVDKYLQAGRGLAAAHAADIIHRDFKPDNVLVGSEGRVRVLDFGLAAPVGDALSESSHERALPEDSAVVESLPNLLETPVPITLEGRIMGTPAYMAPEQAVGEVTTAKADQYSFCVAMWEALYGQRPKRGQVPRVSRRAGPGGEVPLRIRKALERGLAERPQARFDDMQALLAALEPRAATPVKVWLLVAALSVALVLLGGMLLWRGEPASPCEPRSAALERVWEQGVRRQIGERLQGSGVSFAATTWETMALELDRWGERWLGVGQRVCEATHVEHQQSAELLDLRVACLDRQLGRVAVVTETLASEEGASAGAANSLDEALAAVMNLPDPARCLETTLLTQRGSFERGPDADSIAAQARLERAQVLLSLGQFQRARALVADVEADEDVLAHRSIAAQLSLTKGRLYSQKDELPAAEAQLREAWFAAQGIGHDQLALEAAAALVDVLVADAAHEQAETWLRIAEATLERAGGGARLELILARPAGDLANEKGDFGAALARRERTLELTQELRGAGHVEVAQALLDLAATEGLLDQRESARRHIERALEIIDSELGATHPARARALNSLGTLLRGQGQHHAALAHHREALAIQEQAYADLDGQHRSIALTLNSIGSTLHLLAQFEAMRDTFERARDLLVALFGPEHAQLLRVSQNLAIAYAELGDFERALEAFEQCERVALATLGPSHLTTGYIRFNIGELEVEQGNYEAALQRYQAAERTWEALMGPGHELVGLARSGRGKTLQVMGRTREGLALQHEALVQREATLGAESEELVEQLLWVGLGELELAHGREAGALERATLALERGMAIVERAEGTAPETWGQLRFALARARSLAGGARAEVEELARRAEADFERAGAAEELVELRAWMHAQG